MKRSINALVVLSLCLTSSAGAETNPFPDGIGVYFDTGASSTCTYTTTALEPIVAYLIVTGATETTGISWWDCRLELSGPLVSPNWTLAGGGVNTEIAPCFHVKLPVGAPLPHAQAIVVATLSAFVSDPDQDCLFYVRSACREEGPFTGAAPGYGAGDDPRVIHALQTPFADLRDPYEFPVAAVSYDLCHGQPDEAVTWSAVKNMFR